MLGRVAGYRSLAQGLARGRCPHQAHLRQLIGFAAGSERRKGRI
jgi:hypothetical protein